MALCKKIKANGAYIVLSVFLYVVVIFVNKTRKNETSSILLLSRNRGEYFKDAGFQRDR